MTDIVEAMNVAMITQILLQNIGLRKTQKLAQQIYKDALSTLVSNPVQKHYPTTSFHKYPDTTKRNTLL